MTCFAALDPQLQRRSQTRSLPAGSRRSLNTLLVDTRLVDACDRVDFWANSASEAYHPLRIRSEAADRFQARMWGERRGSVELFRMAASSNTMSRTRREIATGDPECLQLTIMLNGRLEGGQRHTSVLGPGDMIVYDTSQPASFYAPGSFDLIALTLPKAVLGESTQRIAQLAGLRVPRASGLSRLALRFVRNATSGPTGGIHDGDGHPEERARELLRRLYLHATSSRPDSMAGRAELLCHAQTYIDSQLGDPSLNPEQIAHACFISTRYLHRLFADEGHSVCEWIRSERLARCRRDLLDPALYDEPIATIATRWGLPSASHFSRLFREANGCSPREFRRAAQLTGGIAAR